MSDESLSDIIKQKLQENKMVESGTTFSLTDWEWMGSILIATRRWAPVLQNRFLSEVQAHCQMRMDCPVAMSHIFLCIEPIDVALGALATKGVKIEG